jgi:hypothetical protein
MNNFDFSVRLERTPISYEESRHKIVSNNVDFLKGKTILEFGVYQGNSLSQFSSLYDKFGIEKKFYGFDSFIGLPKETVDTNNPEYWPEGAFSGVSPDEVKGKLPFVNIKPGWFKDTLNVQTLSEVSQHQIGILHIDCDLYTSTIDVLEWIIQNNLLVDGTIVIYDDWGGHYYNNVGEYDCGEGKAHKEMCEKYGLEFEFISCDEIEKNYHEICIFKYKKS